MIITISIIVAIPFVGIWKIWIGDFKEWLKYRIDDFKEWLKYRKNNKDSE